MCAEVAGRVRTVAHVFALAPVVAQVLLVTPVVAQVLLLVFCVVVFVFGASALVRTGVDPWSATAVTIIAAAIHPAAMI